MESIYAGLPSDLSPYSVATRIVNLETSAAREQLLASVPEQWRALVAHFARMGLATRVVVTQSLEERQRRLAEVPEAWRSDVEAHVRRLWSRRDELRSESWRPGRRPAGDPE